MSTQRLISKIAEPEKRYEPLFYNGKAYELTKLYDEGRLWKVIVTADEIFGKPAEEGLKIAVKSQALNLNFKGVTIEYMV